MVDALGRTLVLPLVTVKGTEYIDPSNVRGLEITSHINKEYDPYVASLLIKLDLVGGKSVEMYARQRVLKDLETLNSYVYCPEGKSFTQALQNSLGRELLLLWAKASESAIGT